MNNPKKQDLERPDLLQEKTEALLEFVTRNKKAVLAGTAALVLLILGAGGWYMYSLGVEAEAQKAYSQAMQVLRMSGPEITAETAGPALTMYEEVIRKYPGTDAAAFARYDLGNIYYRIGDYDKSIRSYTEFLNKSSGGDDLKTFAYAGLGYSYGAKKEYARAIESFEESLKTVKGSSMTGMIYGSMGDVYVEMGKPAEAAESYRKALEQKNDPFMETLLRRKLSETG
ncbi:MAG TPA: tetratricopeptide repeat protein [Syntrophales bacterium]|nr:tetratricopeptide repeat protein [Syntrophales bacterium]